MNIQPIVPTTPLQFLEVTEEEDEEFSLLSKLLALKQEMLKAPNEEDS